MDVGDISLFVNSQALVAGGKTLDVIINEKTDISATGVGTTVFSASNTISTVMNSFKLIAKFIPPMTGIYKCVINNTQGQSYYKYPVLPTLNPVFNTNGSTAAVGISSLADMYNTYAVGATIATPLSSYLTMVNTYTPTLIGSEFTTTMYLECIKGVPCMVFGFSANTGFGITGRTITYGNS